MHERGGAVIEALPAGLVGAPLMIVFDSQGRILLWNRACAELTGYSFEQVRGEHAWDALLAPEEVAEAKRAFRQLIEGEQPSRREFPLTIKSGERRWVGWSYELTRRPNGEVEFVTAIGMDRTDARRAEEALRLSEAVFSGIISVAADAIISVDEEQRIVIYNDGAARIFGWTHEEAIGKPLEILIPERFRKSHREHLERFDGEPTSARHMADRRPTVVGLRKNGEEFSASAAISKLQVGGALLYTAVLRDVSEQRLVERDQRFLSELGAVLATTLDYDEMLGKIAELSLRFLCDCCLIELVDEEYRANRRSKAAHRDPNRLDLVRTLERSLCDRDRPRLFAELLAASKPVHNGAPQPDEIEALASTEEQRRTLRALDPTSWVSLPLTARGRSIGAMLFFRSGPSRPFSPGELELCGELAYRAGHALESARLYRTAREALHARDQMLSIVAHDLRNPLSSAQLVAEQILARQAKSEGQQWISRAAETISRSLRRASRLIQDLMDVTRIDSGGFTVVVAPVAAAELLADSARELAALAANSAIELLLDSERPIAHVLADRERVLQVLSNLIGNAIKFTPRGGRIRLSAARRGNEVCFSVTDDGPGISAEDMPRLFDRFWQALPRDRRGAGLGLPIAKGIVEAHGGRIWVDSTPGAGSTFHFSLPVAGPGTARAEPLVESAPARASGIPNS